MVFGGVRGFVVKSPSPRLSIVVAEAPLPLGEYVELRYGSGGERVALAVVSNSSYEQAVPQSALSYLSPRVGGVESLKVSFTSLYVIAEISGGRVGIPTYPIPPDTPVTLASPETLSAVYGGLEEDVRLGVLACRGPRVEVRVNPDKLAKHLLIAGATGSGKSNTVAVLADRLSTIGAPVVIFDVHGEYNIVPEDGDTSRVKIIKALINPLRMPPRALASIIIPEPQARRQRRILRRAIEKVLKKVRDKAEKEGASEITALAMLVNEEKEKRPKPKGVRSVEDENMGGIVKGLMEMLMEEVQNIKSPSPREDPDIVAVKSKVLEKVEEFFEVTPVDIGVEQVTRYIEPGRILVVDASNLDDEQRRWMLKVMADEILAKLKGGFLESVVLVVEEAPLFIGAGMSHPVKQSLQRFAREARKFGGSLIVVSQRPRSLDINVVSQLQNFVFLRMVQEEDIRAVMNIADNLDENLAKTIPSLPDGRAIVMGEWLGKFPAVVDIDLHKGKKVGATPPLKEIWRELKERKRKPTFNLEI